MFSYWLIIIIIIIIIIIVLYCLAYYFDFLIFLLFVCIYSRVAPKLALLAVSTIKFRI
jgi:hypothetical protein